MRVFLLVILIFGCAPLFACAPINVVNKTNGTYVVAFQSYKAAGHTLQSFVFPESSKTLDCAPKSGALTLTEKNHQGRVITACEFALSETQKGALFSETIDSVYQIFPRKYFGLTDCPLHLTIQNNTNNNYQLTITRA